MFDFLLTKILPNFVEAFILIGYFDVLNKPATIVYYLCFKKETLEIQNGL